MIWSADALTSPLATRRSIFHVCFTHLHALTESARHVPHYLHLLTPGDGIHTLHVSSLSLCPYATMTSCKVGNPRSRSATSPQKCWSSWYSKSAFRSLFSHAIGTISSLQYEIDLHEFMLHGKKKRRSMCLRFPLDFFLFLILVSNNRLMFRRMHSMIERLLCATQRWL